MQYYVYQLIDLQTNEVFYVGKGQGQRMYQHVKDAKNPSYCYRSVHRKIQSILTKGQEIKYGKIICESELHALELEQQLIRDIGRKDLGLGPLCNLTDGGEGSTNTNPESIERRAAKHRGMKRSDEAKLRMKEAQLIIAEHNRQRYGKGCSPLTAKKMSKSRKGKQWSKTARSVIRNKPTAVAVRMFDSKTGAFVKEVVSISEAAKEINCSPSEIWSIMVGRLKKGGNGKYMSKTVKGHRFLFYDLNLDDWQERILTN